MTQTVHIIPVGFDYERLLHPISKGSLDADRVRLVEGQKADTDDSVLDLADRMLRELEYTFKTHFEIEVENDVLNDIYSYREVFQRAYEMLTEELSVGNTVWVNISSMPRTVAFAFAAAANAYVFENPDDREQIHTYYVRPEKYFAPEMLEQLEKEAEFLDDIRRETEIDAVEERHREIRDLVNEIERSGITKGAQEMGDGRLYVEFPASPLPDLRDFEIDILKFLAEAGAMPSTSALARELGRQQGENPDAEDFESFRSKVQYNVDKLEDKGYITRVKKNNSFETMLSVQGELWIETHTDLQVDHDHDRQLTA